ncbi:diphosphomevalonate decarboxylase [Streptomyces sp. NPDC126514]|uniref:diphosphomevalonate decarboxylase n=1 Tax=Streptomyces sp. NPDC126514 TaxID=3155210 RepID=UPI00331B5ABC
MIWATANANLALVKYWGKSSLPGNQAANASLSVTLDGLTSLAAVRRRRDADTDRAAWSPPGPVEELTRFVGQARTILGIRHPLDVTVTSNFPVGAGLASSASAYAALTTALAAAAGRSGTDLSALARSGSGSACRSLLAGFVEWQPGAGEVTQIAPPAHWPLCVIVAVTREKPKAVSSREGMRRTATTSPFYDAWLTANPEDMRAAREAVRCRDLDSLGPVMERNALRMHATALGADPPLLYWEPATLAVVHEVRRLRESGAPAYFSIDAGPQVKVLCEPAHADRVADRVGAVPGVSRLIRSRPGDAPRLAAHPPSWAQLPPTWESRQ